jgi:hypothetical protein
MWDALFLLGECHNSSELPDKFWFRPPIPHFVAPGMVEWADGQSVFPVCLLVAFLHNIMGHI